MLCTYLSLSKHGGAGRTEPQLALFSVWGEPKNSNFTDPVLLPSEQDCSLLVLMWATLIRGTHYSASITLCSHRMVSHNPSLSVYLEPWNPWKVLEMHWTSCYRRGLMQWQYCQTKKLPHPFSRSFVKLYFIFLDCCFLLYGWNDRYHLIIPLSFIGSNWTRYLCFSVLAPLAGLLCCFYPLPF